MTSQNGSVTEPPKKKKKKPGNLGKAKLSFGNEDEGGTAGETTGIVGIVRDKSTLSSGPASPRAISRNGSATPPARRLTPNPDANLQLPKVLTKASLHAEAVARDSLRKEFLALQETVKATNILIPFVFYDGTNIPGGTVKVKKGNHIWVFLERCRKMGAELGVSGSGGASKSKNDNRKEWARVGVDDLMCVRGEVIVPHVRLWGRQTFLYYEY